MACHKYHRKPPIISKIHKVTYCEIIDNICHIHDWMFIDSDITNVEILPPTLDNLILMRRYSLFWVLKGFRNPFEYSKWNSLRIKYGIIFMGYSSRLVGQRIIGKAIESLINNECLPNQQEVDSEIEEHRLIAVIDTASENRIKERERYKRLYEKYSYILRSKVLTLIKQHRLRLLEH